jgi:hypothetical protein
MSIHQLMLERAEDGYCVALYCRWLYRQLYRLSGMLTGAVMGIPLKTWVAPVLPRRPAE